MNCVTLDGEFNLTHGTLLVSGVCQINGSSLK